MKKLLFSVYLSVSVTAALFGQQPVTDKTYRVDSGYVNVDGGKLFYEKAKERLMFLRPYFGRDNRVPTRPADRVAVRVLSEIKVPALILVGEYDHPDVHAHAGAINAGIRNSKREIIPKSGHLIPLEQPVMFNEMVLAFLNKLPR